jgi:hypothetical protein
MIPLWCFGDPRKYYIFGGRLSSSFHGTQTSRKTSRHTFEGAVSAPAEEAARFASRGRCTPDADMPLDPRGT